MKNKTQKQLESMDHGEMFLFLCKELKKIHGDYLQTIADDAGVSLKTLYNWRDYRIMYPQLRTVISVGKSMGYDLQWRDARGRRLKLVG